MRKSIYSIFLLTLLFCVASCNKDDDDAVQLTPWGYQNVAYMDSLAMAYNSQQAGSVEVAEGDSLYKVIPQYYPQYPIYYKRLKVNDGFVGEGECPKFTDNVTVYYKGYLIDGTQFDSNFKGDVPDYELDIPTEFLVSGLEASSSGIIYGWTEILQLMRPAVNDTDRKGDFWRVYIPYDLGYGSDGSGTTIPGFSSLVFDINLVKVTIN